MSAILRTESLGVSMRGTRVLHDINVTFAPGRITALLGPNGAGKSTLLNCLSGLRTPDQGRALLGNAPVPALDRLARARRIGLLPQSGDIHWDVDVATLVGLGRFPHKGRWGESDADRAAVSRAMVAADVTQFATRGALELSGGERSRVLLARVLAGEPEWLLADEPLASLDPAHQLDVLDRMRDVAARGAGVIIVLHDLTHAVRVADDIVLLRQGRLIAQGSRTDVMKTQALQDTFGVDAHIGQLPGGEPYIVPLRRSARG